jgi:hypothetical protein
MATTLEFDIVPASLAVKAMRDSGYKNAAYAIAELVDNAVQAGASLVEILCQEEDELVRQRTRSRLKKIAVLDNGGGMDSLMLRRALQFGNGARLNDRSGIGRFGMGLPNSSISQARRVDVWTWQDGYENAMHSYLDVGEIEHGDLNEVPHPTQLKVPQSWIRRSESAKTSKSGTLVVWSELDKCDWKTALSIFKNSEYIIGRIYRHFIGTELLRIRMADFFGSGTKVVTDADVCSNDPLYLIPNSALPEPWNHESMFEPYGAPKGIDITLDGKIYTATVSFSVAKKAARETREGHNAGDASHGKHAKNNIGVSVVRAGRELELQTGWCNQHDTRERWWGAEVSFPPDLDELFGVTNNKQSASSLAEFSVVGLDQIAEREGYSSEQELITAWQEDHDPRLMLVNIKKTLESNIATLRSQIKAQATPRGNQILRHLDPNSAETIGTQATKARQIEGRRGTSDLGEGLSNELRIQLIEEDLTAVGVDPVEAKDRAHGLVSNGQKYEFYKVGLDTAEFFTVRPKGGSLLIGLNTNHPAYDHLITLMESGEDDSDVASLKIRLRKSYEGLKLLLEAWARYEDELTDGIRKERAQEARLDWGRVAREFLRED